MDNDVIPQMIVFPVDTIHLIRVGSQAQHAHEHAGTHERFFPRLEQTCWGTLACSHTSVSHTACTYTSVSHQCYDTLKRTRPEAKHLPHPLECGVPLKPVHEGLFGSLHDRSFPLSPSFSDGCRKRPKSRSVVLFRVVCVAFPHQISDKVNAFLPHNKCTGDVSITLT